MFIIYIPGRVRNKLIKAKEITNKCLTQNPVWKQAEDFLRSLNTRGNNTDIVDN